MEDVDEDGLIIRRDLQRGIGPDRAIQEFFHERTTIVQSVDGPAFIANHTSLMLTMSTRFAH